MGFSLKLICNLTDLDIANLPASPYRYSIPGIKYYFEYAKLNLPNLKEESFVVYNHGIPFALCPISNSDNTYSSQGQILHAPYFYDASPEIEGIRFVLNSHKAFAEDKSLYSPFNPTQHGIWGEVARSSKVQSRISYVNLELDIVKIKSNVRKSYKSIINRTIRELEVQTVSSQITEETWGNFVSLHRDCAGKITRSTSTWDLQFEELRKCRGLLTYVAFDKKMVGAALFLFSPEEAIYAVGAFRRDLKDYNLGHACLWKGIIELKQLGISRLRLGELVPEGNDDLKAFSISTFKSGFSTSTESDLEITY